MDGTDPRAPVNDPLRNQLQSALGDAYAIERELGGGGMSRVFLAEDTKLHRHVVIKVLAPELAAGLSGERFEREIELAAGLMQANIVPLLAAGHFNGLPYYTMPFVEGLTLRDRLAKEMPEGRLPVPEVVGVLRDVARALKYAHERGVVHRDIKPENVLLSGDAAVVTDFGIAKAVAASKSTAPGATLTQIGTSLGTPAYMAPEQAAGDPAADHRADIYAFGVMAYELLTGATPFAGRPPHQQFAAHMTEAPAPLASKRPDIPVALDALVMHCLAKNPGDRPQSAAELLRELDDPAVVSGQWVSAPSAPSAPAVPSAAPSGASRRGRPVIIGVAALVIVVVAAGAAWRAGFFRGTARGADAKSIAVLPLANLAGDTADAYFADGMTEELTGALSKVPGLRVASRSAAFSFRGKNARPSEIGHSLNVATLLEGTVRRAGNRLRLTASLTNAPDGLTLWSETYEREVQDVFKVQDDIANAIVGALRVQLGSGQTVGGNKARGTENLEAYDLYLRGRYFFQKRGDALQAAIPLFRQAIAKDPAFARAYAGLGDVYGVLPLWSSVSVDSAAPIALEAIDRAIALDPTLAEAYASRGTVLQLLFRWDEAVRSLRRATELDPQYATAHQWLGEALIMTGHATEAVAESRRAVELDPVSPVMRASQAFNLSVAGDDAAAMAALAQARVLDSTLVLAPYFGAWIHIEAGRRADGLREIRLAEPLMDSFPILYGMLGYCMAVNGETAATQQLLAKLEQRAAHTPGYFSSVGMIALGLGDHAKALDWLGRSARSHESFFGSTTLAALPFDPLRTDPKFVELLRLLNLPPAIATAPRPGYHR